VKESPAIIQFEKTLDARFICSACGADGGCNRNKVTHHDALEFPDGTLVKLTRLTPG